MKNNDTILEKMEELNELVAWFNSDDFSIEEALTKYKEAEELALNIEKDLLSIKNQINIVKEKFSDNKGK